MYKQLNSNYKKKTAPGKNIALLNFRKPQAILDFYISEQQQKRSTGTSMANN